MELNWSTFVLEIINFVVLVWILKRFLYKPVLNIVAQRRAAIEHQSAEAQREQDEASSLKKQYQDRLLDWEKERQKARDSLSQELESERALRLQALQAELALEREKAKNSDEQRRLELTREIEHQALQQGGEFASHLLKMASGPELEACLITLLLDDLAGLSPDQKNRMGAQWSEKPGTINIDSAYPLTGVIKSQLEDAIGNLLGKPLPVIYSQTPELLAGLLITVDAWVLRANVRDELKGFTEFAYVSR